ncbi:unnamed protein product [Prorocentrum cordatum]|uniref:Uncharacterized protein n=1 Tax=Prorocentrum cordatum TaxID=2364126 RepID=A0ABN9W0D2_9DINO|nr:unnamed protein product [Polarella glacialis]
MEILGTRLDHSGSTRESMDHRLHKAAANYGANWSRPHNPLATWAKKFTAHSRGPVTSAIYDSGTWKLAEGQLKELKAWENTNLRKNIPASRVMGGRTQLAPDDQLSFERAALRLQFVTWDGWALGLHCWCEEMRTAATPELRAAARQAWTARQGLEEPVPGDRLPLTLAVQIIIWQPLLPVCTSETCQTAMYARVLQIQLLLSVRQPCLQCHFFIDKESCSEMGATKLKLGGPVPPAEVVPGCTEVCDMIKSMKDRVLDEGRHGHIRLRGGCQVRLRVGKRQADGRTSGGSGAALVGGADIKSPSDLAC